MIKIEILLNEEQVDDAKSILREIGIKKIFLSIIKEYDEEHTHTEGYRGSRYTIDFIEKIKMEILINSPEMLDRTLHLLSVANIDANALVYDISKQYKICRRESKITT